MYKRQDQWFDVYGEGYDVDWDGGVLTIYAMPNAMSLVLQVRVPADLVDTVYWTPRAPDFEVEKVYWASSGEADVEVNEGSVDVLLVRLRNTGNVAGSITVAPRLAADGLEVQFDPPERTVTLDPGDAVEAAFTAYFPEVDADTRFTGSVTATSDWGKTVTVEIGATVRDVPEYGWIQVDVEGYVGARPWVKVDGVQYDPPASVKVPAGTHEVEFQELEGHSLDVLVDGEHASNPATVEVSSGQVVHVKGVYTYLEPGHSILEVHVLDEAEQPVAGAAVHVTYGSLEQERSTNKEGVAVFDLGGYRGQVHVEASREGYVPASTDVYVYPGTRTVATLQLSLEEEEAGAGLPDWVLIALVAAAGLASAAAGFAAARRRGLA